MYIVLSFALSIATAALSQDEDYPPGTLVPEVDLGLQPTPLIVPEPFRDAVPQDLVLNLPPGFSASVFAHEGLRKPRFMAFDPNGVLHVANMGADQIVALPDRNRDGVADERIVSLRGLREAHSLLFYEGALYVAEEHQVIRVRDTDGDLIYEQEEVVLPAVPWEGWHDTRTLVVDRRNDKMYLSVGSPCDLCRMDESFQVVGNTNNPVPHHPERGTILQFNPDGSERRIFATGIRHTIGMDFHPQTNALWPITTATTSKAARGRLSGLTSSATKTLWAILWSTATKSGATLPLMATKKYCPSPAKTASSSPPKNAQWP